MALNNTYGIKTINQSVYDAAMKSFTEPGGVQVLIETCRALAAEGDPGNQGNNSTVNDACAEANDATWDMEGPYVEYSGRNYYDIAAIDPDPFPPNYTSAISISHMCRWHWEFLSIIRIREAMRHIMLFKILDIILEEDT